jgi:8-oxo-dGTP pyrophosphatase MutT (NUDIX family)
VPGRPERFAGHVFPQVLPEPEEIRPGRPAAWSALAPADRVITVATVEDRLTAAGQHIDRSEVPSEPAEVTSAAVARDRVMRRSAVLVGLVETNGETSVILTRRAMNLRHHSGEVAFPGGRSDEHEGPIETAVREAYEEVGLRAEQIRVMGWLHPIASIVSGSAIWPILAHVTGPLSLRIDPREVDRAFTVPLAELLDPDNFVEERWRRGQQRPGADAEGFFPIYFYRVPGDLIWGASARILTELLSIAAGVPWPDAHRSYQEGVQ